jgi:hypothetical protein
MTSTLSTLSDVRRGDGTPTSLVERARFVDVALIQRFRRRFMTPPEMFDPQAQRSTKAKVV